MPKEAYDKQLMPSQRDVREAHRLSLSLSLFLSLSLYLSPSLSLSLSFSLYVSITGL